MSGSKPAPATSTLLLTAADARAAVDMAEVVSDVEEAFAAFARGQVDMPAKVYLDLPRFRGDFRAMPVAGDQHAGVKWVNSHADNPKTFGLPAVMGLFILSDAASAYPLAVMDATWLTAVRTGAEGAVASKHLARKDARRIGLVGCGVQARTILAAHRAVFSDLEVLAADRDAEAARAFAKEQGGRAVSVQEAAACDIVCTLTPSRAPVIERGWIQPGTHINAMGADAPGKQELDPQILTDARIVIDDLHQARGGGEVNVPLSKGDLTEADIHGDLGAIVAGQLEGRDGDERITVFDSTGLAIQDLAVARHVFERARERDLGKTIDFLAGGGR